MIRDKLQSIAAWMHTLKTIESIKFSRFERFSLFLAGFFVAYLAHLAFVSPELRLGLLLGCCGGLMLSLSLKLIKLRGKPGSKRVRIILPGDHVEHECDAVMSFSEKGSSLNYEWFVRPGASAAGSAVESVHLHLVNKDIDIRTQNSLSPKPQNSHLH